MYVCMYIQYVVYVDRDVVAEQTDIHNHHRVLKEMINKDIHLESKRDVHREPNGR